MGRIDTPLDVGSHKQLFIDDRFIADSENVTLTMNPAEMESGPVLVADKPWEARIGGYDTVLMDGGRVRLWYDVHPPEGSSEILRGVCYAESTDGRHWEKPDLGLVEIRGSTAGRAETRLHSTTGPASAGRPPAVFQAFQVVKCGRWEPRR